MLKCQPCISMINTTPRSLKARKVLICQHFYFYEQSKFHAQLNWAWSKFYNNGVRIHNPDCNPYQPDTSASLIDQAGWLYISICASVRDYGTNRFSDHRRLRRVCAYTHTHNSLCCSHTQSVDVDEGSYKNIGIYLCLIHQHWHLLDVFEQMR